MPITDVTAPVLETGNPVGVDALGLFPSPLTGTVAATSIPYTDVNLVMKLYPGGSFPPNSHPAPPPPEEPGVSPVIILKSDFSWEVDSSPWISASPGHIDTTADGNQLVVWAYVGGQVVFDKIFDFTANQVRPSQVRPSFGVKPLLGIDHPANDDDPWSVNNLQGQTVGTIYAAGTVTGVGPNSKVYLLVYANDPLPATIGQRPPSYSRVIDLHGATNWSYVGLDRDLSKCSSTATYPLNWLIAWVWNSNDGTFHREDRRFHGVAMNPC